jgi:hypothetical protein
MPIELDAIYATSTSLKTAGGWRASRPHRPGTPPLLLYDLETDPHCLRNVNEAHPDKVAEYTARLRELWSEHQALARSFEPALPRVAGDEQIEALRTLGYIE